jgi:diaminopimelate decarboxylase
MHHFEYQNDELFCEQVPITRIADTVGTPFFLYSHATLKRHFNIFNNAFDGVERLVCYSAKANTSMAILSLLSKLGAGLDIVSGGELYRGLQAGFDPQKIVYSGVGKRVDEIDYALNTGILMFNIESMEELDLVNRRAAALNTTAAVAIRVNPDVDPKTHPYISTGLRKNKFGIGVEAALEGYRAALALDHIRLIGVDCHIGSQITEAQPFKDALKNLRKLIEALARMDIHISYLDMGGGLGITYSDEAPPDPGAYAKAIKAAMGDLTIKLILEPGRVIVGNAGILVTRTLYRKQGDNKEFIVTDAAMNDLMRPALYDAFHDIRPVQLTHAPTIKADVVGPICESSDFLARDRRMTDARQGDLLAVMSAGAYGFVMSSNYCSRLRAAEVMVDGQDFYVTRERETYEDLVAGESIPPFLEG